jgi:hypothetical protein
MERRINSSLSAILALGLIAIATLVPTGESTRSTGFLCLGCGTFGGPDVVVNIALFLPLGIVLGRAGRMPMFAVGAGLVVSGLIESAQFFIPGRDPTLRDILMNGIGCGLGALLAWRLADWLAPGTRARTLLWLATIGALLAIGLTGALLRFEPPSGIQYGQWVPDPGHLELFSGSLRAAEVGGISVPNGRSSRSAEISAALADRAIVRLDATAGRPTRRLSSIFSVMDDAQEEALLIGPHGDDLVVRVRRVAATWRFDAPEFRFPAALAGIAPGTPLVITFDGTRLGGCATVNGIQYCAGRPRAGSTWSLARSFDDAPAVMRRLLDTLTLVTLVIPFGLLWRSVPRREALAASALLVVGFPVVAWWSGLALPTAWEWLGVALAISLGAWLHTRVRPTLR